MPYDTRRPAVEWTAIVVLAGIWIAVAADLVLKIAGWFGF